MKRLTLIILLLSTAVAEAVAQSIHYSVSGGITFATARYQSDFTSQIMQFDKHSIHTFNLELNTELPVNKWISIRSGIGYQQNGFAVKYDHFFTVAAESDPFNGANPDGTSD